ncbi:MAG: hypothetical protein WC100_15860 [Sterolibacterium sp.]
MTCRHWLLALCIIVSHGSHAQGSNTQVLVTLNQPSTTVEEFRKLQERAKDMKAEAERQFALDQVECGKKVLVANCVDSAKTRKRAILAEANKLNQRGKEGERLIRRTERETRDSRRLADAPRLATEDAARIEQLHRERQQHDADRAIKQEREALEVPRRRSKNQGEEVVRLRKHAVMARKDAELARTRPLRIQEQQQREKEIAEHAAKIADRSRQHAEDMKRREAEAAEKRAAQENARKNAEERVSFLCQLWPERFCAGLRPGK